MIRAGLSVLTLVCALSSFSASSTRATDLKIEGGPGGGPFRVQCDGYMIGFEGRTGAYIDNFRPICGVWDAGARRLVNRGPLQVRIGESDSGGAASASCPDGQVIAQISFQNTFRSETSQFEGFVHHINFRCLSLTDNQSTWRTYGPNSPPIQPKETFPSIGGNYVIANYGGGCPAGELAIGIRGRSGGYVDALGLICGPVPAAPVSTNPRKPLGKTHSPTAAAAPEITPPTRDMGFTGTWSSKTDKGWNYTITLLVDGRVANGSYVAQDGSKGRITGRIGANVMEFNWEQDGGFRGTGQFALGPDGNSFSGIFKAEPHPNLTDPRYLQGTWNGIRK